MYWLCNAHSEWEQYMLRGLSETFLIAVCIYWLCSQYTINLMCYIRICVITLTLKLKLRENSDIAFHKVTDMTQTSYNQRLMNITPLT